ncbi:MAG: hypothetical protein Q8N53_03105 [Longimicrobiales bacterium]|nr:hypothetical protein [Longimicrobiales bacterium]
MTRAEWDALAPRERDALVAEKVMGCITREMVEECHRAIMYVKSPGTESAAAALTTLLDASEGK